MALNPRKGIFIARLRGRVDCWKSSKFQAPSSREAPNSKPQRGRDWPLGFEAWRFFGIWSLEFGASFSVSARQRDEDVFQRRRDGADVDLPNTNAVEALANELLGHRILQQQ